MIFNVVTGHMVKQIPPVDSLTKTSYMSILHSKALTIRAKTIFANEIWVKMVVVVVVKTES